MRPDAFDRLLEAFERCGPIVVIAQKTRIVFMVRVRFGGCLVRRDRLVASIALPYRVEHPRWRSVEEIAPGWVAHRLDVFDGSEPADPDVRALIRESDHLMGEQGRLKTGSQRTDRRGASSHTRTTTRSIGRVPGHVE
jgi:hypothetical protein